LKLLSWKRANVRPLHRALWAAAVEGVAERLRAQYAARWAKAYCCPEAVWHKQALRHQEHFHKAASWLLNNNVTPERMLDVCQDFVLGGRKLKYPLPRQLNLGFVLDMIPVWIPPNERRAADGGFSPDELKRASDEALEVALRSGRRDPWAESELGMMGIDFTETDQEWRKLAK
jgi:hypothetical protein